METLDEKPPSVQGEQGSVCCRLEYIGNRGCEFSDKPVRLVEDSIRRGIIENSSFSRSSRLGGLPILSLYGTDGIFDEA